MGSPARAQPSSWRSAGRPPPQQQWSCATCTLDNPGHSRACDACGNSRPVEVDGDAVAKAQTPTLPTMSTPPARASTSSGCGAGRPPTERKWSCAACTLDNPGHSRACEACGNSRPMEVVAVDDDDEDALDLGALAGASFLPLQRRSMKRERAASPEVVGVCADEGDGAKGGEDKPAKKKGADFENKVIFLISSKWHDSYVELQEVTPNIYLLLQKSDWWQEYRCSLSNSMAMQRKYYCMQMSKLPVESFDCTPFSNSIMGRELCVAHVKTGGAVKLVLATSHLESPMPGPPTWDQMYSTERVAQANKSLKILGSFRNVIFCGDMNWDDKGDGPFPLPAGWTDAWIELKPGEDGWTYDTKANSMLSANRKLQKRLDRFVCKLADFKINNIQMIGKNAIPGLSYVKEKKLQSEEATAVSRTSGALAFTAAMLGRVGLWQNRGAVEQRQRMVAMTASSGVQSQCRIPLFFPR
ncbi:Os12g0414900 [Oryza sativa Japonica Group]|uniref:Os12g0414900 protein n=1 Tax=Oryza sativa subsp. japonica TaxID=39947 RepID=Q0INP9_ORYSJ|nr:Os12g0414900 [Oryza sativa Japonica Group]|eukprot:NP_001066647.2 Os12g0414900 [Oryza sativa Japonica Group]